MTIATDSVTADDPHTWIGRLSMLVALAIPNLPKPEQRSTQQTLDEFLDSDTCTHKLRRIIEEQLR